MLKLVSSLPQWLVFENRKPGRDQQCISLAFNRWRHRTVRRYMPSTSEASKNGSGSGSGK